MFPGMRWLDMELRSWVLCREGNTLFWFPEAGWKFLRFSFGGILSFYNQPGQSWEAWCRFSSGPPVFMSTTRPVYSKE